MLKQGKAWHRGNRKGSVLLTVVIMVMVLFTLTSICLDVIHHSTKVSSRNVQKTQAKLTAEKVLTEFIEGYKEAKELEYSNPGDEDKKKNLFADLMTYANGATQTSPKIIDVSMVNQTTNAVQSDFDANFGKTELHIYMTSTSSFVVESVCTYATQTQTASVLFESTSSRNRVVSHTVESQLGKLIGNNQLTNGIDGSIYIEKSDLDDSTYKKLSRTSLKAHIYSEFSVRFDDAYTMKDMTNTTHGQNDFDSPATDFDQAPTLIVDGYLTVMNDSNVIGTQVGKIDANKKVPGQTGYDSTKLGNYDGFVKIDKKLILPKASSIQFGQTDTSAADYSKNQIDVYTHGIILGGIPSGDAGDHNFELEAEEIRSVFPQGGAGVEEGLWNYQTNSETKIHGNVYAYIGHDNEGNPIDSQDGSIVLMSLNKLKVDGDVFVEGNVYFFTGDGGHGVIDCKNFYCEGDIIVAEKENFPGDNMRYSIKESTIKTYKIGTDGKIYDSSGNEATDMYNYIKVPAGGTRSNAIDRTKVRNEFPKKGYDAQSGYIQEKTLSQLYGDCSANDIFTMSIENDHTVTHTASYEQAAKDISSKYADAMKRSFTINNPSDCSPTGHTVTSTSHYRKSDGTTNNPVVEVKALGTYSDGSGGYCYYDVNASMKFTPEQCAPMTSLFSNIHYIGYWINLTDEDIVIALPLGQTGAYFRVNRDNVDPAHPVFVYLMYYDPNKMDGMDVAGATGTKYDGDACLYYKDGIGATNDLKTTDSYVDEDGTGTTYHIDPIGVDASTDPEGGSGQGAIWMGASGSPTDGVIVGDYDAVDPTTDITNSASIAENFRHNTFDKQDGDSVIMYMIPNDVGFTFIKGGAPGDASGTAFKDWSGNASRAWRAQGLIYGINSNIKMAMYESGGYTEGQTGLLGQIKGLKVNFCGDNKMNHKDCSMADGSLLDYVGVKNHTNEDTKSVKLQYYQY
jgi:hypothetical protein